MGLIEKKFPWQAKNNKPKLLALEPRMLFDGAAAAVVVEPTVVSGADSSVTENTLQNTTTVAVESTDPNFQKEILNESIDSNEPSETLASAQAIPQLDFIGDISTLDSDAQTVWLEALAQSQQQLTEFAKSDRFQSVIEQIYNPSGVDSEFFAIKVEQLRQQILTTGLNISVELRSSDELNGYLAAYASESPEGGQRIFVNKDWINFGLDQQMIIKALLEEIGHAIDFNLHGQSDTSGDEGEYFSRAVSQDILNEEDIQRLTSEDDSGVVFINGVQTEVEHATITFTKAYQGMNSTYTAVGTNYVIETSSIYIGTPISSIAYTFQSANPADLQFSGNNIAGQLTYFSAGNKYVFNGVISRPDKISGGATTALYFTETTVLGGKINTGKAFLLVMPGYESRYTINSSVSTASNPIDTAMNEVLSAQSSNRNPVITSNGSADSATIYYSENSSTFTPVTKVTSTDADSSDTMKYSIYGGADASLFLINSYTGNLTFKTSPDYESPTDADRNNIYNVSVMVADSKGATDTQALSVVVTNVNDNAPVITSNGGSSSASVSIPQLTTEVTQVIASDLDSGDVLRYSLSGTDSSLFTIDQSSGKLSFITAPTYNNSGSNSYSLTVTVTDIVVK